MATMKTLVVDDDLTTGALLNKILGKQGYNVTHVIDGVKALQALQTEYYRIILTDWMMPEMDGPTLCRHIRELELPQYVYIILLTAKSAKNDAVAGLESGADDYIIKPFDKSELLARIRVGRRLVELEDAKSEALQKLTRSEKLAAVGHLAAGVAHEINNPIGFINSNLNSLKNYTHDIMQMLFCYRNLARTLEQSISQSQLHSSLPKLLKQSIQLEQEYDIDFIMEDADVLIQDCSEGAERIKAIVNEMRYFAHPEQRAIEACELSEILQKVVSDCSGKLPLGSEIINNVGQLPKIAGHVPHIEQAFANLLQNALEAIDCDGRITVEGRVVGEAVEIEVMDNGRGISPENLSKVFDPFFTTKDVGQGIGLGLTTALNIINLHNGSIRCQSASRRPEENRETAFIVSLPVHSH
jgi:signal transduction histidine kinase